MQPQTLIAGILGLITLTGCAMPVKNIHTEIVIDAERQKVWDTLAATQRYPRWNPYHVRIDGPLSIGETLHVTIHKPDGNVVEIDPQVRRIIPRRELTWGGGIRHLFTGEHVFLLETVDTNKTRLIHKEQFRGILIPFAKLEGIEEGYMVMNAALKREVEGR